MTIVRIWRGVIVTTKVEQYLAYLNKIVIAVCRTVDGNEGLFVMKDLPGELAHFLLLSFWSSVEALVRFAGTDAAQSESNTRGKRLRMAFESTARRYSVIYTSKSSHTQ